MSWNHLTGRLVSVILAKLVQILSLLRRRRKCKIGWNLTTWRISLILEILSVQIFPSPLKKIFSLSYCCFFPQEGTLLYTSRIFFILFSFFSDQKKSFRAHSLHYVFFIIRTEICQKFFFLSNFSDRFQIKKWEVSR